ncbi:hypothetical protein PVAP13_6KG394201 [Panicum virgatum]|uniref:Uncharacterized protein n=1 Tax=Panicum virgatum TaxID=38727 RepID=A0A8T0RKN7_PANVG|nr:hypothetical protein PVAP13_6KG394201 [Panicum virgatum]
MGIRSSEPWTHSKGGGGRPGGDGTAARRLSGRLSTSRGETASEEEAGVTAGRSIHGSQREPRRGAAEARARGRSTRGAAWRRRRHGSARRRWVSAGSIRRSARSSDPCDGRGEGGARGRAGAGLKAGDRTGTLVQRAILDHPRTDDEGVSSRDIDRDRDRDREEKRRDRDRDRKEIEIEKRREEKRNDWECC